MTLQQQHFHTKNGAGHFSDVVAIDENCRYNNKDGIGLKSSRRNQHWKTEQILA